VKKEMKKKWLIVGVIIILITTFLVWNRFFKVNSDKGLTDQDINITINPQTVMTLKKGNLRKTVSTSGYLQSVDEKVLSFNLNGEVKDILVDKGDKVTKGEDLIKLDKDERELNYLKIKNAYELIKINGSDSEIEETKLDLTIAEKSLEDTTLKAPFSGLITEISVKPGDYVTQGEQVAYLIDDSSYEIDATVNEIDSLEIKKEQEVIIRLDAFPNREFAGKVKEIDYYTENANGVVTLPVVIQVNKAEPEFRPGFSALLEITVDKVAGKLLVPITAIFNQNEQPMVAKIIEGKAKLIPVKTGVSDGVYTVIEDGLIEGDQIMINTYQFAGIKPAANANLNRFGGGTPMMGGGRPRD
jgi:multidrug efflux pump subunit AcrA (membrane-fusion protein)